MRKQNFYSAKFNFMRSWADFFIKNTKEHKIKILICSPMAFSYFCQSNETQEEKHKFSISLLPFP